MNEYNRVLTAIYREDHLTKKQLAADIGIAPATLNRIFADLVGSPKTRKQIKRYLKNRPKTPKWDCFVSVFSQPQQQFVAVTVLPHDTAETLQLNQVAFPIGWTPGDQFNAQTKSLEQVEQLLLTLKSEVAERYLVVLPTEAPNLLYPQSDLLLLFTSVYASVESSSSWWWYSTAYGRRGRQSPTGANPTSHHGDDQYHGALFSASASS